MATRFPFVCLSRANQKSAAAQFFDACENDGYLVRKNCTGATSTRSWDEVSTSRQGFSCAGRRTVSYLANTARALQAARAWRFVLPPPRMCPC